MTGRSRSRRIAPARRLAAAALAWLAVVAAAYYLGSLWLLLTR